MDEIPPAATGDATGEPAAAADGRGLRRLTAREKVVRAFLRDGRLVDRCFPEDRDYEEKEVNMRLALLHPDVAALRRYLVDGRLMTREAGIYRRARPMAAEPPMGDDPEA